MLARTTFQAYFCNHSKTKISSEYTEIRSVAAQRKMLNYLKHKLSAELFALFLYFSSEKCANNRSFSAVGVAQWKRRQRADWSKLSGPISDAHRPSGAYAPPIEPRFWDNAPEPSQPRLSNFRPVGGIFDLLSQWQSHFLLATLILWDENFHYSVKKFWIPDFWKFKSKNLRF